MNIYVKSMVFIYALSLAACSDKPDSGDGYEATSSGGSADIIIEDVKHHFSSVECFKGFKDDLMVVLENETVHFEISQLDPSQNTWTVKYNIPLGNRQYDEYFTRKYAVTRNGNKITGTAMAERGKLPRDPVDISIDVTCQKMK